jgi:hypothetical protein
MFLLFSHYLVNSISFVMTAGKTKLCLSPNRLKYGLTSYFLFVKVQIGNAYQVLFFTRVMTRATVGMFDWRLFDNSNRTSYVRQPSKVGMFDLDYVRHGAAIVEHNINRTLTGT